MNASRSYGHRIGGETVDAAETFERRSPATGEPVASFARGTERDVGRAVAAAQDAFVQGPWPKMSGGERAHVLRQLAAAMRSQREHLGRIEVEEVGKPIGEALGDIDGSIAYVEHAAGLAEQIHGESFATLGGGEIGMVLREPVGPVGLITPWNFPALLFCRKAAFALAAGCTAVVKPSELASGSALEIATLAEDCDLPAGALNVVTGYGPEVGAPLVDTPTLAKISFTGSTRVGRMIAERGAGHLKRPSLELGGKAATVVFDDADLEKAADSAVLAAYFNQGECCVAGCRLLVQEGIADAFVDEVANRAAALRVGNPLDPQTQMGALIHEDHAAKVENYIKGGRLQGAKVVLGGERFAGEEGHGSFLTPTVIDEVDPSSALFTEEIFGPVLSVSRFADREHAFALANATEYGLATTVWTGDANTAFRAMRALQTGFVWVNTTLAVHPQMPVGGLKASGVGQELGEAGIREFTLQKTCVMGSE